MASRPAPRVPAGESSLAALAQNYQQQRDLWDAFEGKLADGSDAEPTNAASRASWTSLMHNGSLIMRQPPTYTADLLITIGMASSYIDGVIGLPDCPEKTTLLGVQSAIDNAFKFLIAEGAAHDLPVALSPLIEEFCRNTGAPQRGPAPQAEAA